MQNLPLNGQILTNDIGINGPYPKVQFGGTEPGALYFEDVEVAGIMYQKVQNAAYIKWSNNWVLIDPTKPAYALSLQNGTMQVLTSPAQDEPFSAWQVVQNIVGKPQVIGVKTSVPADGSASVTINLSPAFPNATTVVSLTVGANYTGTDNAFIGARLASVPTASQIVAIVAGGQPGSTVDLHYVAFGS